MKVSLQICCEMEMVDKLEPTSEITWCVQVQCLSCDTESPTWHHIAEDKTCEFSPLKGLVSFCMKCKFCKRPGFIDVIEGSRCVYTEEDKGHFKTVVSFDVKGIEPVNYCFEAGWNVKVSNSDMTFENINLSEGDWLEYDSKSNSPISISDIKFRFHREN